VANSSFANSNDQNEQVGEDIHRILPRFSSTRRDLEKSKKETRRI